MQHTTFWAIGEISSPEKGGWPGLAKSDGRPQNFVKGSREVFWIFSGPYIGFDTDLH